MSMGAATRIAVAERSYLCSDGVCLAARVWSNVDSSESSNDEPPLGITRRILCLHGWLDNSASFDRLAPLLLDATTPTKLVALDL